MRALVFPGQGSQYPGMGRDLYLSNPIARRVFEEADDALGLTLSRICFEGSEQDLALTENTQPAILTVSIALWKALPALAEPPAFVAGHSLGEYSALVAAGSLSFTDAVRIVRLRGRFMQEAVPVGVGAMAAILGLGLEKVEAICAHSAQGQVVSPANINAPGQVVVAGDADAVERACQAALEEGALRAKRLPVSAPFHCALMMPAQERLAAVLADTTFRRLDSPLVNNVDAKVVREGEQARQGLVRQVTGAVRWTQAVQRIADAGVDQFVEIGPGKVLTGLIKRIVPQAGRVNVESDQQVAAYV